MAQYAPVDRDSWILKFKKNPLGILSFTILLLATFLAIFAYVLAPDNAPNDNSMHLSLAAKPPGYQVMMCVIPNKEVSQVGFWEAFLHGKPKRNTEIPITAYQWQKNTLKLQLLAPDADGKLTQVIEAGHWLNTSELLTKSDL